MLFTLWKGVDGINRHIKMPSWEQIRHSLLEACEKGNSVNLYLVDGKFGQDVLSLSVDSGCFLVDLYLNSSDDDDEIVSLNNPNWKSEGIEGILEHGEIGVPMIEIRGNYWSADSITTDINLVEIIFKEFFETGKITHPWMQLS